MTTNGSIPAGRSLRVRLTVAAAVLFGVALFAAGATMVGMVEREARSTALATVDQILAEQVDNMPRSGFEPGAIVAVGDGVEFGLFRRENGVAFGSMYLDGAEVAIVELNLVTNEINELLDPITNKTVTDPKVVAASEQLLLASRDLSGVEEGRVLVGAVSPSSVEVSTAAAKRSLWYILPPVWLIGVVLTWLLVGRALGPVVAITRQTRRISTENLHERVPVPRSNDEIGRLANTINAMLERLEQGDERRRRFAADVSHELRTPLAAVRSAGEVIALHPDRADTLAPEVVENADRLERIIDDLLALAVLDQGDTRSTESVDLADLVRNATQDWVASFGAQSQRIDLEAPDSLLVVGREAELRRVVDNLISNAVRHASEHVRVGVAKTGTVVEVIVEDDGPGIPDDQRVAVFERFVRLDEARSRDSGGAGLGLALTKAVIDSYGGTVRVASSPTLGGARLEMAIPTDSI